MPSRVDAVLNRLPVVGQFEIKPARKSRPVRLGRNEAGLKRSSKRKATPQDVTTVAHRGVEQVTEDQQRAIAYRYTELQLAISRGSPGVARKYDALCRIYQGRSNKFLHSFASARDKRHWAWQLEMYLFAEIEPQFWPAERH